MSNLNIQYQQWLDNNPKSKISYDDWMMNIFLPKMGNTISELKNENIDDIPEWGVTLMDGLEEEDFSELFEEQPNHQEVYVRFPNESYYILSKIDMKQFKPEKTYKECTFGWYGDLYIAIKNTNE
jgi:hypothetical protein